MKTALDILQRYWQHQSFRPQQEAIIESALAQTDTLAILPTGGGKSICYQIPALVENTTCIVISPLIALMKDQVQALQEKGIKAMYLESHTTQEELITLFDNFKYGNYTFLYLSPERLQSNFIQEKLKEFTIGYIAIDEAHCISEWGHDFRPSYRNINILKTISPSSTLIAVTATATAEVEQDILTSVAFKNPKVFKSSFSRPQLAYQVFEIEDKFSRFTRMLTKVKTPAIVYVNSRKKTEEVAFALEHANFKATHYHGGMSTAEKNKAFELWMKNSVQVMVATNAFGMGIDKEDVGLVVHLDIPSSIENYVQEAGRAGRNNTKAFAVLLHTHNDRRIFRERFENTTPTIVEIKTIHQKLYQYTRVALGELPDVDFYFSIQEFCDLYQFSIAKVQFTLTLLSNHGILHLSQNVNATATLSIAISSKAILQYKYRHTHFEALLDTVLRSYTGIFDQETAINEFQIAKKMGGTSSSVKAQLKQLSEEGVLHYNAISKEAQLRFLVPREDDRTINSISKTVVSYIRSKKEKVTTMLNYIANDSVCRSTQLRSYFGEEAAHPCGICDVCLSHKKIGVLHKKTILELLKTHRELSSHDICLKSSGSEEEILILLRQLMADEIVAITKHNLYYLV